MIINKKDILINRIRDKVNFINKHADTDLKLLSCEVYELDFQLGVIDLIDLLSGSQILAIEESDLLLIMEPHFGNALSNSQNIYLPILRYYNSVSKCNFNLEEIKNIDLRNFKYNLIFENSIAICIEFNYYLYQSYLLKACNKHHL